MAGATWTKLPGAGAISGVAGAACVAAPVLGNLSHVSSRVLYVSYRPRFIITSSLSRS